jgi:cytochrome c biogenesis protein CcmG/thiol:disulfide interchange protein DsbE
VRVWLPVGLALVLIAGVGAWVLGRPSGSIPPSSSDGLPTISSGHAAPAFDLARLGGGAPVSLAAMRGRPVVLNFFASWCPNCRSELTAFAGVARTGAGRVDVVGIDTNDTSLGNARSLLATAGATYPVGVDPKGTTATAYRVVALPTTIFLSRTGRVVGEVFGAQTSTSLRSWLAELEQS